MCVGRLALLSGRPCICTYIYIVCLSLLHPTTLTLSLPTTPAFHRHISLTHAIIHTFSYSTPLRHPTCISRPLDHPLTHSRTSHHTGNTTASQRRRDSTGNGMAPSGTPHICTHSLTSSHPTTPAPHRHVSLSMHSLTHAVTYSLIHVYLLTHAFSQSLSRSRSETHSRMHDLLTHSLAHSLTHSLTPPHSCTHWLRSHTHSLTHSLIDSPTHLSPIRTHQLTFSPAHPCARSLTHVCTHSFAHSPSHPLTSQLASHRHPTTPACHRLSTSSPPPVR